MKKILMLLVIVAAQVALAQSSGENRPPHGPPPNLTDAQKSCLQGILGTPGQNPPPSHDAMDAAFKTCGIQAPPHQGPPPENSSGNGGAQ